MRWDDQLAGMIEDLEQQAAGLYLADRDAEVADRSRAEYAQVTFISRVRASVGEVVGLELAGVGSLNGALVRVGKGWLLLESTVPAREWVVCIDAISAASGLDGSSVSEMSQHVAARLDLRSVLRGLADSQADVVVHLRTGAELSGRFLRVGEDFAELADAGRGDGWGSLRQPGRVVLVPFRLLSGVRRS